MNTGTGMGEQDEDVVVIEQRDKRTYVYLALALVVGLAIGGLAGSSVTLGKWKEMYQSLQKDYQTLEQSNASLNAKASHQVEQEDADKKSAEAMSQALKTQEDKYLQQIAKLKNQITEVEKVNLSLEDTVAQQKVKLDGAQTKISKLDRQTDMQATMFDHAKQLFQRELKVKQELSALETEREQLEPQTQALKKECDLYLAGTSWNAKSDSCDKQDQANSRLSQVDQEIQLHRSDLKQIQSLTDNLGLAK